MTKTYLNNATQNGFELKIYVQTGAKKTEVAGEFNGRLKIRLNAPPTEGKANDALIDFLSEIFSISKSNIKIMRGLKSRQKDISTHGTAWNPNWLD